MFYFCVQVKEMKEIKIIHITGNQINGRSIVASLFLEKESAYKLNFEGITFISRSAAHELLTTIDKLKENNVEVKIVNITFSIGRMIKQVDFSRKTGEKLATFVNRLNFNTTAELDNFILSI